MKRKHTKTLELIFTRPASVNIQCKDAVSLMEALGAEVLEREGSRVAFILDGAVLHQHKPHPSPDMDKGAVAAMRDFLKALGYKPGKER